MAIEDFGVHQAGVHSERVLNFRQRPFYVVLTIAYVGAAIFFFMPWLSPDAWQQPFSASALFLITAIPVIAAFGRWIILLHMRRPRRPGALPALRVAVVTTYVPAAEPFRMLEFTLKSLVELKYPHDCWLLDEGNDADAIRLCRTLGVHHFSRINLSHCQQDDRLFKASTKYGNYNAWLYESGFSKYDVIIAFDPDHVAHQDFIVEVLTYFDDPQVAYVQTPQAYYNQAASFISRGAAEETYDFNSTIQMAGYGMGYPLILGCHNAHRVSALQDVGGFAPHDADDLMLTMLYRNRRWRGVYVPRILARGITPVDWDSYLNQQRRWARSVFDLKIHLQKNLNARLPFATKVASYVQGLAYLQPGVLFPLAVLVLIVTVASGEIPAICRSIGIERTIALMLAMSACYRYRQQFFLDPSSEAGVHLRARLLRVAKAPVLLLAIFDVLLGRRFNYVMTPKVTTSSRGRHLVAPFGIVALMIAMAWFYGMLSNLSYQLPIHILATVSLAFCILLIASDFRQYPDPFDERLLVRMLKEAPLSATHAG